MDRSFSPAFLALKRPWRFSLATMLIVVTVAAIFCGKLGNRIRAVRAATTAVASAGGIIAIERPEDWWHRFGIGEWTERVLAVQSRHVPGNPSGNSFYVEPGDSAWIQIDETEDDAIFREFDEEWSVLSVGRVNDNTLAAFAPVGADLQFLEMGTSAITDAGMQYLASFPQLRVVFLTGATITDAGAATLAPLQQLELVDLKGTAITDATLERLAGLPNLRWLRVEVTQVTPEGIRRITQALPGLNVTPDPDRPDSEE
jgi:hypothetical protein